MMYACMISSYDKFATSPILPLIRDPMLRILFEYDVGVFSESIDDADSVYEPSIEIAPRIKSMVLLTLPIDVTVCDLFGL